MKSRSILKRIIVVFVLIAVVFGGINLFWYGFKYQPYKKLTDHMPGNNDPDMPRYVFADDNYIYKVKMPGYLSFDSGFLYIGPNDEEAAVYIPDDNGNLTEKNKPHVDIFIWPQMFSETEYGLTIYEETYSMQFMINSLGEYLPDETVSEEEKAYVLELFETHRDEIQDILRAANELWGNEIARHVESFFQMIQSDIYSQRTS